MDRDLNEHFTFFMEERISDVLRENKELNPAYIKALANQHEYAEHFPEINKNGSPADTFFGLMCATTACENEILYLQGIKDCVALLKEIGLL